MWLLGGGATFAAVALAYQWASWGELMFSDLDDLAKLVLLFWSPYAALAGLTLWLGRTHQVRAVVLLIGSLVVTAWGLFWHLDILVVRPDTVAQILSPLLIPGTQWVLVGGTAVLALLAGLLRGRSG